MDSNNFYTLLAKGVDPNVHISPGPYNKFRSNQWRSKNAENVTHIKGRLLDQAVIPLQSRPFSKWELLLKERIRSQRGRILSFKSSSFWYGNYFYRIR